MTQVRLSTIAERLRAPVELSESLWLKLGEVTIRLRSNSGALIAKLEAYFGSVVFTSPDATKADIEIDAIEAPEPRFEFLFRDWPRDGGKVGRKEAYADFADGRIIQKLRTGMHFLIGHTDLLAIGPCLTNDNQITNFINSQYVSRRLHEGWQLCHAAGVSLNGKGLVIAAKAGAGKSTLALHLMSSGLSYVSNDRVLIQTRPEGTQMAGIPKMPRVNPGTLLNNPDLEGILPANRLCEIRRLKKEDLWELEEKYDVMVDTVYGHGRTLSVAPLSILLILNWSPFSEHPCRFERANLAEREDLLKLVMKSPGVFHRDPKGDAANADHVLDAENYLKHLQGVAVIEATGHADFEYGVRFCHEQLAGE